MVPEHLDLVGTRCPRVGLLPLSRRRRSARWHQLAMAAVRDREPIACRRRALRGCNRAREDGQVALHMGAASSARLARRGHADGGLAESVLARSEARVPVARRVDQPYVAQRGANDLQRSYRRRTGVVLHGHRRRRDSGVGA